MKHMLATALLLILFATGAGATDAASAKPCDQMVALFIKLAKLSGDTVTEAEARAEVLADNPTQAECAAMLAMFEAQK